MQTMYINIYKLYIQTLQTIYQVYKLYKNTKNTNYRNYTNHYTNLIQRILILYSSSISILFHILVCFFQYFFIIFMHYIHPSYQKIVEQSIKFYTKYVYKLCFYVKHTNYKLYMLNYMKHTNYTNYIKYTNIQTI